MKAELLNILRNAEKYISGQELCEIFGVSRTAVWKYIKQLKEEGYEIESIQNKGYKMTSYPDVLSSWEIESRLIDSSFVEKVYYYEKVDSTNNEAKRLGEDKKADTFLVVADKQYGGKGRRGKNWESPSGMGIWMTLALSPDMEPQACTMLTLVAGLAVSEAITKVTGIENYIKWPNDIVIDGKKVCGILTEMTAEPDHINCVVIGIGINANIDKFPEEIKAKATSIKIQQGEAILRADLVEGVMRELEKYYKLFMQTMDMSLLKDEYNKHLVNLNREVKVLSGNNSYEALSKGISDKGELIVKCSNGEVKNIISGEVSVRGVYGYV